MRVLDQVPCICYPVQFQKNKDLDVLALVDSESELNVMTPAYAAWLSLKVRKNNVDNQKINGFLPTNYGMIIAAF